MGEVRTLRVVAGVALLCLCGALHAQQRPDAGQLLRDQPKPSPVVPAKPAPIKPAAPAAEPPDSGVRVRVSGFRIEGARLIPEAELAAQLKDVEGRELTFRELRAAASRLVDYYVDQGYMARVVVPPQEVRGGFVVLRVIEGRRGAVRVQREGTRLDAARIGRFIDRRVGEGEVLDLEKLGEALIILNEQPGIDVVAVLEPGRGEADVDVAVEATERPVLGFDLRANNHGSRASGLGQLGGGIFLANPLRLFDEAGLIFNASDGTTYLRGDFSLAVGDSGWRVGVNAAGLRYRLTSDAFAGLGAHGSANTIGGSASYPITRRTGLTLGLIYTFDLKRLQDLTNAGETSNRHVSAGSVGIAGTTADEWLGGGAMQFGVSLTGGNTTERNAAALAADQAGRRAQGSYAKLAFNASRLQQVSGPFTASATVRGQLAKKNLDSTERFSLGGPNAIRAYPVGEALADQGWFGSAALLYSFDAKTTASAFFDAGGVCLNWKTFAGWEGANPRLRNCYQLKGAGVGIDWRPFKWGTLTASIARPIGDNPGRDVSDLNADGRRQSTRGWVSVTLQF